MVRSNLLVIVAVAAIAVSSSIAQAAENPNVDAKAMAALQKMGAYLRSLSAFRVQGVTTDEDVLEDGQKIQYSESVDILASTPSRLRAEVLSDRGTFYLAVPVLIGQDQKVAVHTVVPVAQALISDGALGHPSMSHQ